MYLYYGVLTMDSNKLFTNVKVDISKDGIADIQGEIPTEIMQEYRKRSLDARRKDIEVPGFRKGHASDEEVLKRVGEEEILEDAANRALNKAYPAIVDEHKLDVMSAPQVTITKLALGNPLGFTLRVGITPEVKLPNYKKVAKDMVKLDPVEKMEATDEEVKNVINDIIRMHAQSTDVKTKQKDGTGLVDTEGKPLSTTKENEELPELTDTLVQKLGSFKNVEDFRIKIQDTIKQDKIIAMQRKRRDVLAKALIEATKLTIHGIVLDNEMNILKERFMSELKQNNTTLEKYLKRTNQTEEVFMQAQRDHIERQFKLKLVLTAIGKKEDITLDPKEVEQNVQMLRARHPDAEIEALTDYVRSLLTNEHVMQFLENQNEKHAETI